MTDIRIANHGNPNGLSWFVTDRGIERGPFTQAEALAEAQGIMRRDAIQDAIADGPAARAEAARQARDGLADDVKAEAEAEAARDYAEMRAITGTRDGDPVPAWY